MEDFLSLLIFLAICIWLSSARKKRGKQAGSASPVSKPAAGKGKNRLHRTEGPAPSRDLPLTSEVSPQPEADHGSLRGSSMSGTDPSRDDPGVLPYGSLRIDVPEGTDPCHDDPVAIFSGSLQTDSPEGTDPCHPAPAVRRQQEEGAGPASGQIPGFPGDEIVRGFIWGEILNRKRT